MLISDSGKSPAVNSGGEERTRVALVSVGFELRPDPQCTYMAVERPINMTKQRASVYSRDGLEHQPCAWGKIFSH